MNPCALSRRLLHRHLVAVAGIGLLASACGAESAADPVNAASSIDREISAESMLEVVLVSSSTSRLLDQVVDGGISGTGEVVIAIPCEDAAAEAGRRRRAGDLDLPRNRDIDPETVVIEHLPVDDRVALDEERPIIPEMGGPESVSVETLPDRSLVRLVQLCGGGGR